MGSSVSSTPSLERAIKKKVVQSDSPDSRDSDESLVTVSSTQRVVYRKGQPTATPILIYEDTRGEVVEQCIANLMSTFDVYSHSEVITSSFTDRICCVGFIKSIKPIAIPANTGEHGVVKSSLKIFVSCIRNCQMRLTRAISR